MHFPTRRPRRLRRKARIRALVRETRLVSDQPLLPLFAVPGEGVWASVPSMTGVDRTSVDELVEDAWEAWELDLGGVLLFGTSDSMMKCRS